MKRLQFSFFILPVWVIVCVLVSCSESEDEARSNRYGTYVCGGDAVFSFDEDSFPYLPVQVPTFSEEELKRMLIGYKWAEVPDSSYIIQEDGTCISASKWKYSMGYGSLRYDYMDLFVNDSSFCFFKGQYNWEELKKMNLPYWSRVLTYGGLSFERNSCTWVSMFNDKRCPYFRIVYLDGLRMKLIHRSTAIGSMYDGSGRNYFKEVYGYSTYLNAGPSNFYDTLLHDMDSVMRATFPEVYSVRRNGVACEWTEKR